MYHLYGCILSKICLPNLVKLIHAFVISIILDKSSTQRAFSQEQLKCGTYSPINIFPQHITLIFSSPSLVNILLVFTWTNHLFTHSYSPLMSTKCNSWLIKSQTLSFLRRILWKKIICILLCSGVYKYLCVFVYKYLCVYTNKDIHIGVYIY